MSILFYSKRSLIWTDAKKIEIILKIKRSLTSH